MHHPDHGRSYHHDQGDDDIRINIDLYGAVGGPHDVHSDDYRSDVDGACLNLDDPANDDTIVDVLRALHDRKPDAYHRCDERGGIDCNWCTDNFLAAIGAGRERPPGNGG